MRIIQEELTQSQIKVSHTLNPEQNKKKSMQYSLLQRFIILKVTQLVQNSNHLMEDLKLLSEVFAA